MTDPLLVQSLSRHPQIRVFPDAGSWRAAVCKLIFTGIQKELAFRTDKHLRMALPGGTTAAFLLPGIAALPLPWQRLTLLPTDDRQVPVDHPDSNEGLLRKFFPHACIESYWPDSEDPATVAARGLPDRFRLDMALIGMGNDGHIASLFPESGYRDTDSLVATDRPDYRRLSLGVPILQSCPAPILAIAGMQKCETLARALETGPASELPVRHILGIPGHQLPICLEAF